MRFNNIFAQRAPIAALCVLSVVRVSALGAQTAAKHPVGGSIDLGYVTSSGNTSTTTFSLGENLTWTAGPRFVLRQKLRSIYGEADSKVNANLLDIEASGDYRLFDGLGATLGAGFDRNRFAGIARRFEQSVGVSWRTATVNHDSLRVTGGILWTQQTNTADVERKYVAFRAGTVYRHPFSAGAYLQHAMEYIPNIENGDDWRFNSETMLSAALTKKLSLKMSYAVRYDHLPEPTFHTTDRIFTTGFQISY